MYNSNSRTIILILSSTLAIVYFFDVIVSSNISDSNLRRITNLNNNDISKSKNSRRLFGLNVATFHDPKTTNLRLEDGNNNIISTDTTNAVRIPCRPYRDDDVNIVSIKDFYIRNKRCLSDFSNEFIFFHVGKGGGGTIETKFKQAHINYAASHPIPAQKFKEELLNTNGGANTLILNVRDPVDRFVSAFKWDMMRACSSIDSDERGIIGDNWRSEGRTYLYKSSCELSAQRQEMLTVKYKSDPNVMAEALCGEDKLSDEYLEASEDYYMIEHDMKLTQWIDFLIDPPKESLQESGDIDKLIVLPMEKHFDQLIDGYILHLLQSRYGDDVGAYMQQIYIDQVASRPIPGSKHSTSSVHVPPLTDFGECCIARHLEDDYQLIGTFIEGEQNQQTTMHPVIRKACTSWGTAEQQQLCLEDLSSMLLRRSKYLDRSKGTCAELFGR